MKYFIIVASADHVAIAKKEGFAQAGHGKFIHVNKLAKGDGIIYYSGKDKLQGGKPLQQFTAIGHVTDDKPYDAQASDDFKPFRRDVKYLQSKNADIRPMIDKLSFIKNKEKWGFYLMSGFVEISKQDFELIKSEMI